MTLEQRLAVFYGCVLLGIMVIATWAYLYGDEAYENLRRRFRRRDPLVFDGRVQDDPEIDFGDDE